MKKKLLFMSLIAAVSANAQFTDDIESYAIGPVHTAHWENWGAPTDPTYDAHVTDRRSVSGTKSIFVGPTGPTDAVLNLGNKTSGLWSVSWKMYIPTDSTAYYNFQEVTPVTGGVYAMNTFWNQGTSGVPGECIVTDDAGNITGTFTYPEGQWFDLDHIIDLDNDMVRIMVDGSEVFSGGFFGGGNLGGIDFYTIDGNNAYYMDDFSYISGALSVDEATVSTVKAFPNPTSDVLNITNSDVITNVAVYDMLGKQIMNTPTNSTSVVINTNDFAAGTYILKVLTGDKEETLKITK